MCLFSCFFQLLSFRISRSHPFLRGRLPPFGLFCLQPWLLRDVPDPCTLSKQQRRACTRGPHLLTSPTSHFSLGGFQCSAAAHAADDPAFGRKWKLTGTRAAGLVLEPPLHPGGVRGRSRMERAEQAWRQPDLAETLVCHFLALGKLLIFPKCSFHSCKMEIRIVIALTMCSFNLLLTTAL